jgi:hypothetical protein
VIVADAAVVFDPFSEDFFNGPYETYRRMREDLRWLYRAEADPNPRGQT